MKRFLAVILAVCALIGVGALGGCSYTPTAEEKAEALEAFKTLYPMSVELNEYIFGAGLPTEEKKVYDSDKSPLYVNVSEDAKYKTEESFKNAILAVYSEAYFEDSIEPMLFTGYENDKKTAPRYKEVNGLLQRDILGKIPFDVSGRFDVSTAKIEKITAAYCLVKCAYKRGELTGEFTVTLAKTANGWRFDALTV